MILIMDTSSNVLRLGLVGEDSQIWQEWQTNRELAVKIHEIIRDFLLANNYQIKDIAGIGVRSGPGSFTGLRIGLTVANTLADSLGIPIVGSNKTDWQKVVVARLNAKENDMLVMPEYGAEANITKPL